MGGWLKQSTAATIVMGPFLDSTDGNTTETALTLSQADIRLSKNGGAFAQTNNVAGATHMEVGNYSVPLDTTDTNTLGRLRVHIHEAGALAVWDDYMVVPANVYDSLIGGSDNLQVDTIQVTGTAQTAGDIIGDTNDIQSRLPAALTVGGNIKADALAWAGAVTATDDVALKATLAKGTDLTGFTDLDAAGVRTAVGLAAANLDTQLTTIDDFLDTEVAAIKAKTDSLTFTVAGVIDANVLRLNGVAASASNLEKSASVIHQGSVTGATTTTTLIDSGLTEADTDFWKGRIIIFTSGALLGQATDITAFTPATDTLTFTALTAAPGAGVTYVIV